MKEKSRIWNYRVKSVWLWQTEIQWMLKYELQLYSFWLAAVSWELEWLWYWPTILSKIPHYWNQELCSILQHVCGRSSSYQVRRNTSNGFTMLKHRLSVYYPCGECWKKPIKNNICLRWSDVDASIKCSVHHEQNYGVISDNSACAYLTPYHLVSWMWGVRGVESKWPRSCREAKLGGAWKVGSWNVSCMPA